jgi:hypothetical protein
MNDGKRIDPKDQPAQQAIDFLQKFRPGGPWVLLPFDPDRGPRSGITTTSPSAVAEFVHQNNGRNNLYFSINPTFHPVTKKTVKQDIAAVEFVQADLDPVGDETPAECKARHLKVLESFSPAPSIIIDTGNGLQVMWRLDRPIPLNGSGDNDPAVKDVEARCKALIVKLGGDVSTHNVDRIFRLPGTVNLPNEKKRAKGRVRGEAKLLKVNDTVAPVTAFPKPDQSNQSSSQGKQGSGQQGQAKPLPQDLIDKLCLRGDQPGKRVSRSELFYGFILEALRRNIDENLIVNACLDPAYKGNSIFEHVQQKGGATYVKQQIAKAANTTRTPDGKREVINIVSGKMDQTWRKTERALLKANCPVYERGRRLVQPLWRVEKVDGREVLSCSFESYNWHRLADVVGHHAVQYLKYDRRTKEWHEIDPPKDLMERIIEIGHWNFKTVTGIINTPTLRPDGSLLEKEGYDEATQLWYKSSGDVTLPSIPAEPSKDQAQQALSLLNKLLVEFPYAAEYDKSAGLSGMMTPPLRGALQSAVPLFLINANEARSGKTYKVHLISVLASGHIPVPTSASEDPVEFEKRIETAALEGRVILHLNNLANGMVVESNALTQFASEGQIEIRKLGRHETGLCNCKGTTIFLNGNNVTVAGDLVVRTVVCRLNARMERPEEREFKSDPIAEVRKGRGKYLAAIFTIALAYQHYLKQGGEPVPHKIVAGFETWSKWVQQSLIWLGMEDPLTRMEEMRSQDVSIEETQKLIITLKKQFEDRPFTVADCAKLANAVTADLGGGVSHTNPDMYELMLGRRGINERSFGKKLVGNLDKIYQGWAITLAPGGERARVYRMRQITEEPF